MKFLDEIKRLANAATETTTGFTKTALSKSWGAVQVVPQTISENNILDTVRSWVVSLFVRAIQACSTEQDRTDMIVWLTIARETLSNNTLSLFEKAQALYNLMNSKRIAQSVLRSISEAFANYKNSDLPLALKVAIPVTLGAGTIIGGSSVGIAGFGTAIGAPVLLLIFLGVAGVTSVLEAFLSSSEARDYISVIMAVIAKDELLRRANQTMRQAMTEDIAAPNQTSYTKERDAIRTMLLNMDAYEFEKHIMSFFQQAGLIAWVTRKSNDAGVDGFARHPNGLIIVQCKRNSPENGVGRPIIQQIKGVIEENDAWRGYVVTTSYFTSEAIESAEKNNSLILVEMQDLIEWHCNGIKFSEVPINPSDTNQNSVNNQPV